MADKLTIKQEKFVQGLFAGLSQREAYKQAFSTNRMSDNSIDVEASNLAKNPKITPRLEELTNELKERNMVTVERVIEELAHIAFDDIRNYLRFYPDPETKEIKMEIKDSDTIDTRSVSEVSIGKDGQFKFKLYCKDDALVKLGDTLGIFKSNLNINANMNVQIVDDIE